MKPTNNKRFNMLSREIIPRRPASSVKCLLFLCSQNKVLPHLLLYWIMWRLSNYFSYLISCCYSCFGSSALWQSSLSSGSRWFWLRACRRRSRWKLRWQRCFTFIPWSVRFSDIAIHAWITKWPFITTITISNKNVFKSYSANNMIFFI